MSNRARTTTSSPSSSAMGSPAFAVASGAGRDDVGQGDPERPGLLERPGRILCTTLYSTQNGSVRSEGTATLTSETSPFDHSFANSLPADRLVPRSQTEGGAHQGLDVVPVGQVHTRADRAAASIEPLLSSVQRLRKASGRESSRRAPLRATSAPRACPEVGRDLTGGREIGRAYRARASSQDRVPSGSRSGRGRTASVRARRR